MKKNKEAKRCGESLLFICGDCLQGNNILVAMIYELLLIIKGIQEYITYSNILPSFCSV